ncbi:MAG: peptidyl-prolyl cis-trans isomerase [Thermodesulfobacteriota bacterium]
MALNTDIVRPLAYALLLLPLVAGYGCERGPEQERKEEVVLTVGSRSVTTVEFRDYMKGLLPEGTEDIGEEDLKELKRGVLNQMVEEELILQEAERLGTGVTAEEFSQEVMMVRHGYGEEEFKKAVAAKYSTMDKWKEEIRRKVLIRKVVSSVIGTKIEITEETARAYYDENISEYEVPEQVRVRMITVNTEEDAKEVKKRLRKEKFAGLAEEVSVSPEARDGGDLGFFGKGDMPEEFEAAVFSLKPGRISKVVKSPYGYHIFKVEEKKKGRKLGFKDVKDDIMERLRLEEAGKEFDKWLTSLKENTTVEINEALL